jgi:flagellin
MGMRINQNIAAMNSYRNLSVTEGQFSKSLEKLSSGFRINRAADDAAGLAISEKLRGQVSGLNQASANAQNGISLIQTAEGALNESHSILQRMRELAVQSSNDTNTSQDRGQIQKEVDQLSQELTRIGNTTEFNTKSLLNGDNATTGLTFQIGANEGQSLTVKIGDVRAEALGVAGVATPATTEVTGGLKADGTTAVAVTTDSLGGTLASGTYTVGAAPTAGTTYDVKDASNAVVGTYDSATTTFTSAADATKTVKFGADLGASGTFAVGDVAATYDSAKGLDVSSSAAAASKAITTLQTAIDTVSDQRSTLGAVQNRLDHTINNLGVAAENLAASESRIRDTDMAAEMMKFTRAQILSQAGTSMLAQANQAPQGVLSLLR